MSGGGEARAEIAMGGKERLGLEAAAATATATGCADWETQPRELLADAGSLAQGLRPLHTRTSDHPRLSPSPAAARSALQPGTPTRHGDGIGTLSNPHARNQLYFPRSIAHFPPSRCCNALAHHS